MRVGVPNRAPVFRYIIDIIVVAGLPLQLGWRSSTTRWGWDVASASGRSNTFTPRFGQERVYCCLQGSGGSVLKESKRCHKQNQPMTPVPVDCPPVSGESSGTSDAFFALYYGLWQGFSRVEVNLGRKASSARDSIHE